MVKIPAETRAQRDDGQRRMTALYASLSGDNEREFSDKSVALTNSLRSLVDVSVGTKLYAKLRADNMPAELIFQMTGNDILLGKGAYPLPRAESVPRLVRAMALREQATSLFRRSDFAGAVKKYRAAIEQILPNCAFPSHTYFLKEYLDLGQDTMTSIDDVALTKYVELIENSRQIAQCYVHLDELVEAIDWLYETQQIMACAQLATQRFAFPSWLDTPVPVVEYWTIRFQLWLCGRKIFSTLGNTGAEACYSQFAVVDIGSLDQETVKRRYSMLHALHSDIDILQLFQHRHPEPNILARSIRCPKLQVAGVWDRQLYEPTGPKPCGRNRASTWIWHGSLYVAGGYTETDSLDDVWVLDLTTRRWRSLNRIPFASIAGRAINNGDNDKISIHIWNEKAYCFIGLQRLGVLELKTEQWKTVQTSMPQGLTWPYRDISSYGSTIMNGVLYVFGGTALDCVLGNNLLMALDLETLLWARISGTIQHLPPKFEPEARTNPAVWAVPSENKIYILYGSALRSHALLAGKPHGSPDDYTYTDFWSYNVVEKKWIREKLRGNHPAWRTEMAHTYAPNLERAVIYGGYNSSLKTADDSGLNMFFKYSYFGDTFLYDPRTNLWQHVLVKGFPAYRAHSSFVYDPDNGRLYIFGGYTNSEYVPAKRGHVKMYNDLWQLKIDIPGGNWNPKDLERDIRMESAGPWRVCFTCGVCGIAWQKCGGTCGGKYFFCSKDCQKQGWKEHKERHGCRRP